MKTYLVGGAVRDQMMGNPVSDMDYVIVGATHEDMIAAGYERVGADFPVYLHPTSKNEYALARTERKSGKGYLGFEVDFKPTITLKQDLERRDLTINSIALSEDGDIFDPFGGVRDIHNKVLRHTSEAFAEDPLRVIRLARFYARFDAFTIAPETVQLAIQLVDSGELEHLSRERFWSEMEKTFKQTKRLDRFFAVLDIFGVMDKVSFFKDVFGSPWCLQQSHVIPSIAAQIPLYSLSEDIRLGTLVALIANVNAKQESQVIPTRVKKLTQNMRAVRAMHSDRNAEKILGLLKSNRAFNEGGSINDTIMAMYIAEQVGEKLPLTAAKLQIALNYAAAITGVNYQHLSGPEVGKAIDAARLDAIKLTLK